MELGAEHVVLLDGGGELRAVLRRGSAAGPAVKAGEGVDKVHVVPLIEVGKDRAPRPVFGEVQAVPAHVRHIQLRWDHRTDGAHFAGDESQTLVFPVLKGALQQQLHTKADAQQGLSRGGLIQHHLEHACLPQLVRRVTEGTHAGENDVIRLVQHLLVPGDHRFRPDGGEGTFQGEQVAHPVVDDGDHFPASFSSKRISTARAWAVRPSFLANRLTWRYSFSRAGRV